MGRIKVPPKTKISAKFKGYNNTESIEGYVCEILGLLDIDHDNPDFTETPRRVAAYLQEFVQNKDLEQSLSTVFDSPASGMVVQANIPFRMMCAHHLLPAYGMASLGYIPNGKIVGLSKLCRLVQDAGVSQPSVQEHLTDDIADAIEAVLAPRGSIVVIKAIHSCLTTRGVNTPGVTTVTSSVRGAFRDAPQVRAEFFELCQ